MNDGGVRPGHQVAPRGVGGRASSPVLCCQPARALAAAQSIGSQWGRTVTSPVSAVVISSGSPAVGTTAS